MKARGAPRKNRIVAQTEIITKAHQDGRIRMQINGETGSVEVSYVLVEIGHYPV